MANKIIKKLIRDEKEFSLWFKKNFRKMGYDNLIRDNNGRFPDFTLRKNNKVLRVELETLSSNFIMHKHNIKNVDEIVCIEKDVSLEIPIRIPKDVTYKSRIRRISATIDEKTCDIIKSLIKDHNYRNKSHVIEAAIELLKQESVEKKK